MSDLRGRIASSALVIGNLPEIPGYNGSLLQIDDDEAERIAKDLMDAAESIAHLEAENKALRERADHIADAGKMVAPEGWVSVPAAASSAMLDRAVSFALNTTLSSEYTWPQYMADLWKQMLAGAIQQPAPPSPAAMQR